MTTATTSTPAPHRKWAHEPLLCISRGVAKIYCRCSWQSRRGLDEAAALAAHEDHVGLKKLEKLAEKFNNR